MSRPSRVEVLMHMAKAQSMRGTCSRLQVGAIVHRDGRVLTTGYNGAPAGLPHCEHSCTCSIVGPRVLDHAVNCRSMAPCEVAAHAERNAIDWAARHGIRLDGAEMVTTDYPCWQCAGSIINAGIVKVVALRPYRDTRGREMLEEAGLEVSLYSDEVDESSEDVR